ncbi:MAG: oxidoreductase domain protein [Flaviaesturariibacter sp.]|nr:oxidoreductase domain protein [Flaviaesturariibacter sp.]
MLFIYLLFYVASATFASMQIAWGIIGCGDVTEVKSGPAFNKVPHSKLVAVMRRDAAKAADYARRHGVPRWYSNAQELIADPEVNAIYIATPPDSHETYALQAIAAGKPVYIEKPVTLDAPSAQRIADAASASGVKVSVAHYRRRQPLFQKVKSLLDQQAIGDVRTVELRFYKPHVPFGESLPWRLDPAISGGGLFHDLAPHQLDLMRYFFGPAKEYNGMATNRGGHYEADDTVAGQILFGNGVLFNGSWCFAAYPRTEPNLCTINGSDGIITFSIFDLEPVRLITAAGTENFSFAPLQHVHQPLIEAVVPYFRGEGDNPVPIEEAVEVMQWMDAFTKKSSA